LSEDQPLHSVENHNFHIKRYGFCVYCNLGSRPVPKAMMVEGVQHPDGWVEYKIKGE